MSIASSLEFTSRAHTTTSAKVEPTPSTPELAALARVAIFGGLSSDVLAALAAGASVRRLSRRALLASEGSIPAHIFIVLSGRIRAVRRSVSGREVTLESFQAGDLLADSVVAPERQLLNDWEASEPAEVLAITREVFVGQFHATPALALTVAAQMLARLDRSKHLAAGLALADVPGRVVAALRDLAQSEGQAGPEGVVVHNRPTQQEMANSIGACRETVSRVVSDLARRGLIIARGRTIIITRQLIDAGV